MERAVALKKLSRLLGKNFQYEFNPKAPTPEEREAAKAAIPAATEEVNRLDKLLNERRRALLDNDPEYQALVAQAKEARNARSNLNIVHVHRITVGHVDKVGGLGFFHVKASGDSWEEVIAKLTTKADKYGTATL